MEKRSDGKRLLRQTDYTLLKRVLCGDFSLICLDADDLTVLREGELLSFGKVLLARQWTN